MFEASIDLKMRPTVYKHRHTSFYPRGDFQVRRSARVECLRAILRRLVRGCCVCAQTLLVSRVPVCYV